MAEENPRDRLSQMAQRRYDIELRRMTALYGEELGRKKTDHMARRWGAVEKKLAPLNMAAIWRYWRRGCKPSEAV